MWGLSCSRSFDFPLCFWIGLGVSAGALAIDANGFSLGVSSSMCGWSDSDEFDSVRVTGTPPDLFQVKGVVCLSNTPFCGELSGDVLMASSIGWLNIVFEPSIELRKAPPNAGAEEVWPKGCPNTLPEDCCVVAGVTPKIPFPAAEGDDAVVEKKLFDGGCDAVDENGLAAAGCDTAEEKKLGACEVDCCESPKTKPVPDPGWDEGVGGGCPKLKLKPPADVPFAIVLAPPPENGLLTGPPAEKLKAPPEPPPLPNPPNEVLGDPLPIVGLPLVGGKDCELPPNKPP
jgi:hypothetical protein